MANHVRQQIRAAVVTAVTGLSTTAARVYVKPAYNRPDNQLPALEIQTGTDQVVPDLTRQTSAGVCYGRALDVQIDIVAKKLDGILDQLDTIAKEIETALYADETLGGLAQSIDSVETDVELSNEQDQAVGRMSMMVRYLYTVRGGAPDVAL